LFFASDSPSDFRVVSFPSGAARSAASSLKGIVMTQAEMERELADATGESLSVIRCRGFSLIVPETEPLVVDWDEVQQVERSRSKPRRRPIRRRLAA
jgi:hypothetical protein